MGRIFSLKTFEDKLSQDDEEFVTGHVKDYLQARKKRTAVLRDGALSYCYLHKKRRIMWKLINLGVPVDESDSNGNTLLISSSANGDLLSAKRLLKFGANVNHKNAEGETAFSYACVYNHLAIAKYLLEFGADPNPRFRNGDHLSENELLPKRMRLWLRSVLPDGGVGMNSARRQRVGSD